MNVTSAQANKILQAALFTEANRARSFANMMTEAAPKEAQPEGSKNQTSHTAPIVKVTDLQKTAGDEVDMQIFHQLNGRPTMGDKKFSAAIRAALVASRDRLEQMGGATPYGVPYRPNIWGAGWDIQSFGFMYYFLVKSYPDLFNAKYLYNALNFVLGCHPGSNTASFASGIGAVSTTTAYGLNRADWSYIPGGVVSGTTLIRPDFPELLKFPYLWQQTEYVLGGGSSHYMFLVLAARQLLGR